MISIASGPTGGLGPAWSPQHIPRAASVDDAVSLFVPTAKRSHERHERNAAARIRTRTETPSDSTGPASACVLQ